MFCYPLQHGIRFEVTGHDHNSLIGGVVGAVVRVERLPRQRVQIGRPADDRIAVAVCQKGSGLYLFLQPIERVVLAAFALAQNHSPFQLGFGRVEDGIGHAVTFDTQGKLDPVGRQGFEIGRPVRAGHPVEEPAGAGDRFVKLAAWVAWGALKEHVFDPVADARSPWGLVAAADPIKNPEAGDRRAVAGAQKYLQPVGQGL